MSEPRVIYVCSTSKAGIVNHVPALEFGPERIAKVVILRGFNDKDNPRDRTECIVPAHNLTETLRQLGIHEVVFLGGRPFDMDGWPRTCAELARAAEISGHAIWLNITGGTRDMALGLCLL